MTSSSSSSTPHSPHPSKPPPNSKQTRMRDKAEEINLVLLQPDVDLWKLRELALTEGGLVNDTLRRRAWPKLVGLTSYNNNSKDSHERKVISMTTPPRKDNSSKQPNKNPRKGTAPERVTNFGEGDNRPGTAFTGGPFDQHDTAAAAPEEEEEEDNHNNNNITASDSDDDSIMTSHVIVCLDGEQIERDVTRCTWHLLTGGQRSRRRVMLNKHRKKISRILRRKQRRLGDLINLTLAVSEVDLPLDQRLCYYQGYHDVASIFLAALGGASTKSIEQPQHQASLGSGTASEAGAQAASMGLELSSKVLYQVSLSHFREPMRNNFLQLQTAIRMTLFPLLRVMDPELHNHLYGCGMEPFFALPWVLTWFAHDIRDTTAVKRLFDLFLCSHPLMPIYLSVAMLCHPSNRQEVLATPCEFAELHSVCAGLPKNSSMVGWKYRVGDGYVSDDEEVGEDGETSISLDSDMASHQSGGQGSANKGQTHSLLSGSGGIMRRDDLILSEDHEHVISNGIPAHVPFQQLIDMAINFMGSVPPRKLDTLVKRYFEPQQAEPMLEMYPTITLFHAPPSWAMVGTAKADWVLKQRAREQMGLSPTSRKDRRALGELRRRHNGTSNSPSAASTVNKGDFENDNSNYDDDETRCITPEMVEKAAKLLKWPKAMVAQGFGPGIEEVIRQRKRRKLLLFGGAATVAVIAIAIGVSITYAAGPNPTVEPPPSDNQFVLVREETPPPVKSTVSPAKVTKKLSSDTKATIHDIQRESEPSPPPDSFDSLPTTVAAESQPETSISAVPNPAVESNSVVSNLVAKQFQKMYAKVQLLIRTVEFLKANLTDPELRHNLRRIVSGSIAKISQTLTDVQDPEGRANLQTSVTTRAVRVTQGLGRHAINALKMTVQLARENLGGENLEELELGA